METFAHEAVLVLGHGASVSAPGGAVTVALCGHWEHEGPCAWPHNTSVLGYEGDAVTVKVEFSCEPDEEDSVRRLIRKSLHDGAVVGPHGTETWTLVADRIWSATGAKQPDYYLISQRTAPESTVAPTTARSGAKPVMTPAL